MVNLVIRAHGDSIAEGMVETCVFWFALVGIEVVDAEGAWLVSGRFDVAGAEVGGECRCLYSLLIPTSLRHILRLEGVWLVSGRLADVGAEVGGYEVDDECRYLCLTTSNVKCINGECRCFLLDASS